MPAAVCQVVVSLSVERTSLQTRAGDVHGHHPSASAAERVRVRVCIGAGLEGRGGGGRGKGLETLSFFAHNKYTVYIAVIAKSHAKMIQNTATIYCFIVCKILTLKYI